MGGVGGGEDVLHGVSLGCYMFPLVYMVKADSDIRKYDVYLHVHRWPMTSVLHIKT